MKLSSPKQITWWIALILAVVGLILHLVPSAAQVAGFWVVLVSAVLLLVASVIPGL